MSEGLLGEHTGENCRYCPVCVAIGVLRGERPEVTEKLAAAGIALLAAFRTAFEHEAPDRGAEPGADAPQPGRVQRIDLD